MTITLDAIALPDDLIWVDEYSWSPVGQKVKPSLTGALIVQEGTQLKGRPITLKGDAESAWVDKATLDLIRAKLVVADLQMTLTHNTTPYTVIFDRKGAGGGCGARGIFPLSDPAADHIYILELKFIEV